MKEFTLGFIFDKTGNNVLLVHKMKPAWQAGRINGIGGKVEEGETPAECIARETLEEACLVIPATAWIYLGRISTDNWEMHTFATTYNGNMNDAKKGDYEEVAWFPVDELPQGCIQNLTWLIPFARERMEENTEGTFQVRYENDVASS